LNWYKKILGIFLFLLTANIYSQQLRLDAVLDTSKIRIGEQAKIDIYVTYNSRDKDIKIQWPSVGDTITEKIEVIAVSAIDTTLPDKTNSNKIFQHQQILVSVYDSGFYALPPFKFIINDDTLNPQYTNTLFLEVHTVPTDTSATKLKDIKPPLNEEFNWKWYLNYIYFGIGILVLVIVIVIVLRYYAKKNKQINLEPEKPKIPPHFTALAALEKIKADQVWREGKTKEYYSSISETIRAYIEDRFNVHALESTTDEIMTAFRSQVIDKESKDKLQQLLTLSDLVKFAKMFPIEDEHNFTLQNGFDFVNGTKRDEEMPEMPETTIVGDEQKISQSPVSSGSEIKTQQRDSYTEGYTGVIKPVESTEPNTPQSTKKINASNEVYNKKQKTITTITLAVLLSIILSFAIYKLVSSSPKTKDESLSELVENVNKMCPVMIDTETRLNKVTVSADKTVQFDFVLVNISATQMDVELLKSRIEPSLINEVKTNAQMKAFRDNQAILQYDFSDKKGTFLFSTVVKPEDYNTYY
jgi:hypothetical protein